MPKGKDEVKVLDCQVRIVTKKGKLEATVIPLFESGTLVKFEVSEVKDGRVIVVWKPLEKKGK